MLYENLFVVIIMLTFLFALFLLLDKYKLWRLRKKYNPYDDKSRQGEERARKEIAPAPEPEPVNAGHNKLEGRELLPSTSISGSRKNRKSSRGIFRKLQRR